MQRGETDGLEAGTRARRGVSCRLTKTGAAVAVATCLLALASSGAAARVPARFQPAVPAIAAAARERPVVVIGELHGWSAEHRFLRRLVGSAALRAVIDDVVVEFGNARFQPVMDAYIKGEPVDPQRLRRAWLNTTQGSVWSAPDYEAFFRAIRDQNRRMPPARRLRVLLGDPPYDPRRAVSHDFWLMQRDIHFAQVIHRNVLSKGRRALVIAGIGHVLRDPEPHPTLTNLLEGTVRCETDPASIRAGIDWCDELRSHPPTPVFVLVPHLGGNAGLLPQSRDRPAIARLKGTELGARPASLAQPGDDRPAADAATHLLEDVADAYLVLAP